MCTGTVFFLQLHQSAVNKKNYLEPPAVLVELIGQTASPLTPWRLVEWSSIWFYKAPQCHRHQIKQKIA